MNRAGRDTPNDKKNRSRPMLALLSLPSCLPIAIRPLRRRNSEIVTEKKEETRRVMNTLDHMAASR